MLALVVLTLLCSSYCAVQSMAVPKMTIPDDKQNWENVQRFQKLNPPLSRTSDPNETMFDIIIRVNAEERGKKNAARTGDSNIFLFEADIAMNKSEVLKLMSENSQGKHRGKRAVMRKTSRSLWKRNIPYALSNQLSRRAKSAIKSAVGEWQQTLTCMGKWVDVTRRSKPRDYLYFFPGGGCYSQVGHKGGAQRVSIGRGCEYHGIAVHEIGHAMGLWHEQSRPDRDSNVRINWKNIIPGMAFNFQKYTTARIDSFGEAYDYGSVMHYGATAFAKRRGVRTIESKRGNQRLGQRNGLSPSDKKQVQLLYGCSSRRCVDKSARKCKGWKDEGYCSRGSRYHRYMQTNCCKTCRSTVPKQKCKDKSQNCSFWKYNRYCTNKKYAAYMKKNCAKSCGCNSI